MASQKDVRNILRVIGALDSERFLYDRQSQIPRHMPHAHYIDSDKSGCWFPQKRAGQIAAAGELIGVMKDNFGHVIEEVRLDEPCIILYQTISYSVPKGTPLVAYGHYTDCVQDAGTQPHVHHHKEERDFEDVHEDIGITSVISGDAVK